MKVNPRGCQHAATDPINEVLRQKRGNSNYFPIITPNQDAWIECSHPFLSFIKLSSDFFLHYSFLFFYHNQCFVNLFTHSHLSFFQLFFLSILSKVQETIYMGFFLWINSTHTNLFCVCVCVCLINHCAFFTTECSSLTICVQSKCVLRVCVCVCVRSCVFFTIVRFSPACVCP